ncbi:alpha/beta hydrolase family esterase [Arenibaculum pallidiluteum]|uniref:alpha/beta hydrolase family esterase n=1 Tax=Arenibaculum pallidiluteum TaxID=2812559 RepID=UPI001A96ED11|nr:hypothetical protein [Arenibaculum pallidiluteum]
MDKLRMLRHGLYAASFLAGTVLGWPAAEAPARPAEHGTHEPAVSEGCRAAPPTAPPDRITVHGRERPLIVAAPEVPTPGRPLPLVIAFHGRTSPAERVRRYYDLETQGLNAVFVYPSALPAPDGTFSWQDPGDAPGRLRDFALFDAIVETMGRHHCIDRGQVFVVGHSLGATFASSLGCARGNAIRGVAAVAGGIAPSRCRGSPAALLLHNPADAHVPLAEGERARDSFLAQAGLAGYRALPRHLAGFACQQWGDASAAGPVLWCLHHEDDGAGGRSYPHTWPDAAGTAIAAFLAALAPPTLAETAD